MIGIFDSGLGGLSVLAAIADALPCADLVYFADTAHVPYGDKNDAFIRSRVLCIGQHLAERGCTSIVIACNTATAAAVAELRKSLPLLPVIGIEPGVKPAATSTLSRRIAVLTTPSTARSERLARLIRQHAGNVCVDVLPCPGWATQVETLQLGDTDFAESVRQHLEPTLAAGTDRIVLGCTHYAFLAPILTPIVAGRATLVDVADAVARQCVRLAAPNSHSRGSLTLLASTRPERLQAALPALRLGHLGNRLSAPARLSKI